MATMIVKNAADEDEVIEKPLAPGRALAAASRPIVLSTEDKAALDDISSKFTVLQGLVDGLEGLITSLNSYVDGLEAALANLGGVNFATQATSAAILAKLIAAPATEAKQDNAITELELLVAKDFATQTTAEAILAKLIAAPATEAKQDIVIGHLDGAATAANQIGATYANLGGTITSGGTAQQLVAANAARRYLLVYNDDDEEMRVNPTGTASATAGLPLVPGAVWEPMPPPVGAISIFGVTTGKRFQAWEG